MLAKNMVLTVFLLFFIDDSGASQFSKELQDNCWLEAGNKYSISPYLLYAMAEKESSFNPLAINYRSDADEDVGLMQINTFWFPLLKKHGIKRNDLFDWCTSVHVGAWVLSQSILIYGNTWEAVGAYNVGTRKAKWAVEARKKYSSDIRRRYMRIVDRLRNEITSE